VIGNRNNEKISLLGALSAFTFNLTVARWRATLVPLQLRPPLAGRDLPRL